MNRICIVGAGAVGAYVGAHAARAGVDMTLIDPWPENVKAIRERGVAVRDLVQSLEVRVPVRVLHVCDVPQLIREAPFDIAFIAVKSYDTVWATHLIAPYLAPTGVVVSLQNGINEDRIAAVVGWNRTLGCAISALAAELVAPGCVVRTSPLGDDVKIGMRVGETSGCITPRAQRVCDVLAPADSCKATTNLWGERWSKLTINAMRNGLCAATGMTGRERDTHEVSLELSIRLGSSCVRVGRALGLQLEPVGGLDLDLLERADQDASANRALKKMATDVAMSRSDTQRPSMGQDIQKGRRTEVDDINGLVAQRGEEVGVDVRLHRELCSVIRRIETGELKPSLRNLSYLNKT